MKLKYAVVYEQTPNNFCAYAPDLPGCISTGKTWDEVREMMREAIGFHLEGMLESGESVPEPRMSLEDAKAYHNEPLSEQEQNDPCSVRRRCTQPVNHFRHGSC